MATNTIPSDNLSIFDNLSLAQDLVYAYPSPLPNGIAGLVFDIRGEERMEFRSEITDHWVEDNTAIHDQISLYPEKVTLKGIIGIIAYQQPLTSRAPTQNSPALPLVSNLQPTFTEGTLQAIAQSSAPTINSVAPAVTSLYQYYLGAGNQGQNNQQASIETRQEQIVGFLYQLWKGRQIFTVETPWGIMTQMAIESCEPMQDETTENLTYISVTFKKLRFAGEIITQTSTTVGRLGAAEFEVNPFVQGNTAQQQITTQAQDQLLQNWKMASGLDKPITTGNP